MDQFQDKEKEELFNSLIERALEQKHTKHELIVNWEHRCATLEFCKATSVVVSNLKTIAKRLNREIASRLFTDAEEDHLAIMIILRNVETAIDFYSKEVDIVSDMLLEYKCYLNTGLKLVRHWLFSDTRPEEDMYDVRYTNSKRSNS